MDKKVFFGHQSVGENILEGIRTHRKDIVILNYDERHSRSDFDIAHARVGKNHHPDSKLADFKRIVFESGQDFDLAMMKFCYVDIRSETNVDQLFNSYTAAIEELENAWPRLRLLHITVPLRCIRIGLRSRLRLLAGRSTPVIEDNFQRNRFNELMRARFKSDSSLFDLAAIESTDMAGRYKVVRAGGRQVPTLFSGYTDDGGHLNSNGRRVMAQSFVQFLHDT